MNQLKSTLVIFVLGFFSVQVRASISCESLDSTASEQTHLSCSNSTSTVISFKEIPAWDVHAGLVLVEICKSLEEPFDEIQDGFVLSEQSEGKRYEACLYRACSDDWENFEIRLTGIPLLIDYGALLSLSLHFKQTQFSVECETIGMGEGA